MKENIARITVHPETKKILDIRFYEENLRFRCKRCAIYCCKLGGPSLTKEDTKQIEFAGLDMNEFVELAKRQYGNFPLMTNAIKSKKDGSCIFLSIDKKTHTHKCSIYAIRPVLCRLYPFDFEKIDANSFLLKIIPCCNGLNDADGELVDEKFIINHLVDLVLEIFEDSKKCGVKK